MKENIEISKETLNKSKLVENYEKDELADMIIDLYDTVIRNNKTIHVLLDNCERLESKIEKMRKEDNSVMKNEKFDK